MQTKLRWKKDFFSGLYTIYSNGQQVGRLKDKTFSQTADGELNGRRYTFRAKGFFRQHTDIIDNTDNRVIGVISYNDWMTKASITVGNKTVNWKYDNLWNTRWSVFDAEGARIQYSGSSSGGEIDSDTDDALLMLTGLYVINYYWQTTIAVLVAVFVPLFSVVLR